MLYNTDGCHGKFLKYQIQVKNEIVLIPPISGSLCPDLCTMPIPIFCWLCIKNTKKEAETVLSIEESVGTEYEATEPA